VVLQPPVRPAVLSLPFRTYCACARFNAKTPEVRFQDKTIADVLALTVDAAAEFFAKDNQITRALQFLQEVGLGYLRLGQPATKLSGGEAQRVKLSAELQRVQRGNTLYVLDEPTTGLHPSDVERLQRQLQNLVTAGNTVVIVEHDMQIVAGSDWVIDIGPGAGEDGGDVVAAGTPALIAQTKTSKTAPFLAALLESRE
jgi:excinuclease ABC subunit A